MENTHDTKELELIYVIVNYGAAAKIVKIAKLNGIHGATVFLGKGTIKNRILELLDLSDIRKEIVMMLADKETALNALAKLNHEIHFDKPNHGIAFSIPIKCLLGSKNYNCNRMSEIRGEMETMYKAIFVIVDKGRAEDAVEAATKAGARGGTIINARGSGIHETHMLFSMAIEPEKEIVLILSESSLTGEITSSIHEALKMDEPGNGIIFVQDINQVFGLY